MCSSSWFTAGRTRQPGQQVLQIVPQKIGDTDDPHLSRCLSILQRTPDGPVLLKIPLFGPELPPRLGRVDEHLVQIRQAHFLQRLVNGAGGVLIGLVLRRHLTGHEQLLPLQAAGADALAHALLVAVGLSRIDEPVTQLHRRADGLRRLVVVNEPCAKPQLGDGYTVCQRIGLLQNHFASSSVQIPLAMRNTAHALGQPQ